MTAGVDMIQIRERDLPARELLSLTESIVASAREASVHILVNDRSDIAASAGAGVHLTTRSMPVEAVRAAFGPNILIGQSTHTFEEVKAAEHGGADFVVFGPVFETASKREYGEPVGIEALREAARRLTIPVLALGGIGLSNFRAALDAGAAGVAGISMFTEAQHLGDLVAAIKNHRMNPMLSPMRSA